MGLTRYGAGVPTGIDSELTAAGEIVPPRAFHMNGNAAASLSGTLNLTAFVAKETKTIGTLAAMCGAAAAVGLTMCRYGVYQSDGAGNLTLIASTPNNAGLLTGIYTAYPQALSSPWLKIAGQTYVLGLLIAASTMPQMIGTSGLNAAAPNNNNLGAPFMAGRVTSQADLPASFPTSSILGFSPRQAWILGA